MASFIKGEMVKITALTILKTRDAFLTRDNTEYLLHVGEVFECTDHSQPDYMDYLNVFCNKRKNNFTLPMDVVSRLPKANNP